MFFVKGTFIDTPVPGELRCREGWLRVEDGRCAGFSPERPAEADAAAVDDHTGALILPGLTDLHLHAPQYGYCGTAMDLELMDWLSRYTYPEEARYADTDYARASYAVFVRDLLRTGTTRCCVFATIHTGATLELMAQLEASGLHAYVGKLSMDRNCPEDYREPSAAAGERETRRWLDEWARRGYRRALPMLTPRFTPCVTDEYMAALGRIARERRVPMQSHLSENTDEIEWVRALCPDTRFYGETYARHGLFGGDCPTVMAHCIYSGEEELALMKKNGVYIAHCPTSNTNVIAGIAPAARYLRGGWKIGLGSDVAGGHTLDLFAVMAAAVQCSKLRWKTVDPSLRPLTAAEALYMATAGGGSFFGKVGLLEDGYAFDAIVLDDAPLRTEMRFPPAERVERFLYRGDGRPAAKYVDGRRLF